MSDRKKFHRLTDLFSRGSEMVVGEDSDAMVVWVARLNSFERAEVQKDAAAGRAKKLHLMRDTDDEMVMLGQSLAELDREAKVDALVNQHGSETYVRALDDIKADTEWREKLDALERGDALLNDQADVDNEEVIRLGELNASYMAELSKRMEDFDNEYRAELEELSDTEIDKKYRDAYLQMIGTNAFMAESRVSEIYFALRECESPPVDFDHSKCDHSVRLCPTRADVRRLPDFIVAQARRVLDDINVPAREAGNSAAPRSSSASSERQDVAEESTPSTPKET